MITHIEVIRQIVSSHARVMVIGAGSHYLSRLSFGQSISILRVLGWYFSFSPNN